MSKKSISAQNKTARTLLGCPQVADGGDGLLMCRIAENVFNNR
jgi:hypothetical protein